MREVVLRLKNIVKEFPTSKKNKRVHAVSDISLDIYENETLALVGESGCGKSTLGKCAIGLIPPDSGESIFLGENIYDKRKFADYISGSVCFTKSKNECR